MSPAYTAASSNSLGSKPPDVEEKQYDFSQPIFLGGTEEKWAELPNQLKKARALEQIPQFRCGFSVFGNGGGYQILGLKLAQKNLGKPAKSSTSTCCKTYLRVFDKSRIFSQLQLDFYQTAIAVSGKSNNQQPAIMKSHSFSLRFQAPLLPNPQIS